MGQAADTRDAGTPRLKSPVAAVHAALRKARIQRETLRQLSSLTDGELNRLGLSRSMLHGVAREAAQAA